MSKNDGRKIAIGAMIAAVFGYLAGILTAPKAGRETRKDIKKVAETGLGETEKQLKRLYTDLNNLIGEVQKKADKISGQGRHDLEKALAQAKVAKQKTREVLSAAHEGSSEDKDLSRAIADAQTAFKHLKQYLTK